MDLDDLLQHATPHTTPSSPDRDRAVDQLMMAAEAQVRAPKRWRRIGLVAAATAGTIGLSTAGAVAAGVLPGWVPWATDDGQSCEMLFVAQPRGLDGEPASVEYDKGEQQRAADEAQRFLSDFDYRTIDVDQAIVQWQHSEDAAIAASVPGEHAAPPEGSEQALTDTAPLAAGCHP